MAACGPAQKEYLAMALAGPKCAERISCNGKAQPAAQKKYLATANSAAGRLAVAINYSKSAPHRHPGSLLIVVDI